jgi:copper resistance protein B
MRNASLGAVVLFMAAPLALAQEGVSESEHVAPEPPQSTMSEMTYGEMVQMMQMDDRSLIGHAVMDGLEIRRAGGNSSQRWDAYAWYGRDEGRIWLKTEGERMSGTTGDARVELLFDRYIARWWSLQVGARHDFGAGPARNWVAIGVHGLAPYFFKMDVAAYVGEQGRAALRVDTAYDVLLTQRLILQPALDFSVYSKDDEARNLGSGLADAELSLRLRYEIHRQFAPYAGVSYRRLFGKTKDLVAGGGGDASEVQLVAGVRAWF